VVAFTTQRTPRKYKNTKPQGNGGTETRPKEAAAVHLDNGIGTTGESTIRSGISEGCGMHEPGEVQKEPLRKGLLVSFVPLVAFVACMASCPVISAGLPTE
jgi:hypothetical protein